MPSKKSFFAMLLAALAGVVAPGASGQAITSGREKKEDGLTGQPKSDENDFAPSQQGFLSTGGYDKNPSVKRPDNDNLEIDDESTFELKYKDNIRSLVNNLSEFEDKDLALDLSNPDPASLNRAMQAAECLIQLNVVLDASFSQVDAVNKVKDFVKQLLDRANVAPGLSALVINAFNNRGYTSATSANQYDLQQNKNFLDGITFQGGTVMSKALELVYAQIVSGIFTPEMGKKIMIPLISDGMVNTGDIQAIRNNIANIYSEVNKKTGGTTIKDAKKYVQFVGIWIEGLDGLNTSLLEEICPEPEYRFVFRNPDSLSNATGSVLNIMKAICGAPATSTPTTTFSPTTTSSPTIGQITQSTPTTKAPSAKPTANPTQEGLSAEEVCGIVCWWPLLLPGLRWKTDKKPEKTNATKPSSSTLPTRPLKPIREVNQGNDTATRMVDKGGTKSTFKNPLDQANYYGATGMTMGLRDWSTKKHTDVQLPGDGDVQESNTNAQPIPVIPPPAVKPEKTKERDYLGSLLIISLINFGLQYSGLEKKRGARIPLELDLKKPYNLARETVKKLQGSPMTAPRPRNGRHGV